MKRDSILIGDTRVEFTVNRSKRRRRTVSLRIHPQHGLVVSAPANTSMARIREIVLNKGNWIVKHLNDWADSAKLNQERHYVSGEPLWLLGGVRHLKISIHDKGRKIQCQEQGGQVEVLIPSRLHPAEPEMIRGALIEWYMGQALETIRERVSLYSARLNLFPKQIIVKEQKTRWGSCSIQGVLRFNWRIIMAPIELVDYIVVHELCHLQAHNHSEEFWSLVETIIPDYKERRTRLRREGFNYEF